MRDLTPAEFQCSMTMSCPRVVELDDGRLLIIGSGAYWDGHAMGIPIGPGETAIIIDRALLANVFTVPGFDRAQLTAPEPYEPVEPYAKPDVIGIT